jgi:hypothetical protein
VAGGTCGAVPGRASTAAWAALGPPRPPRRLLTSIGGRTTRCTGLERATRTASARARGGSLRTSSAERMRAARPRAPSAAAGAAITVATAPLLGRRRALRPAGAAPAGPAAPPTRRRVGSVPPSGAPPAAPPAPAACGRPSGEGAICSTSPPRAWPGAAAAPRGRPAAAPSPAADRNCAAPGAADTTARLPASRARPEGAAPDMQRTGRGWAARAGAGPEESGRASNQDSPQKPVSGARAAGDKGCRHHRDRETPALGGQDRRGVLRARASYCCASFEEGRGVRLHSTGPGNQ